jgi:hypothetical protein
VVAGMELPAESPPTDGSPPFHHPGLSSHPVKLETAPVFPGEIATQVRVNVLFDVRGKGGHRTGHTTQGWIKPFPSSTRLLCCGASAPQKMEDQEH